MDTQMPEKVEGKKKNNGIIKYTVITVLAMVALFCICAFTPIFGVQMVDITGLEKIDFQVVAEISGVEAGDNLMLMNTGKIEKRVKMIPYVHDVGVEKKFPNMLVINVTESTPSMLIPFVTGYIVLDENSKVLEAVADKTGYDYPIIKGVSVAECSPGKRIGFVNSEEQELIDNIRTGLVDAGVYGRITQIDVEDVYDIYITVQNNFTAKMGNMNNFAYKCRVLSSVLDNIPSPPKGYADLTVTDNVFYKENYTPAVTENIFALPSADVNVQQAEREAKQREAEEAARLAQQAQEAEETE